MPSSPFGPAAQAAVAVPWRRTSCAKPAGPIPGTRDSAIQHSRSLARRSPVAGDGPAPTPIMPRAPSADAGAPRRDGRVPRGCCHPGPRSCAPRGLRGAAVAATAPSACRAARARSSSGASKPRSAVRSPGASSAFDRPWRARCASVAAATRAATVAVVSAAPRVNQRTLEFEGDDEVEPVSHRSGQPRLVAPARAVLAAALAARRPRTSRTGTD